MERALDIGAALRFPLDKRAWGEKALVNLLLVAVCFLIPIIGPIVAMGYGVLVEKAMIQDPQGPSPLFDFGKFGEHLTRGVKPFVVGLMLLPLWFLVAALVIVPTIVLLAAARVDGVVVLLVMVVVYGVLMALLYLLGVLLTPVGLRSLLEQKVMGSFALGFVMEFHRKMWREEAKLAGVWLLLMVPMMMLMCIPLLSYFVFAWMMLVMWHAHAQLYRAYVARGGTPLEFLPIEVLQQPAFPVETGGTGEIHSG